VEYSEITDQDIYIYIYTKSVDSCRVDPHGVFTLF
jgi:hypothetical protein